MVCQTFYWGIMVCMARRHFSNWMLNPKPNHHHMDQDPGYKMELFILGVLRRVFKFPRFKGFK
jgi:hypothetical protein